MNADITMPDNSIKATFKLEVIPDISHLATKTELSAVESEIPDISGLATKTEVATVEARIPDVTPLATKTELNTVENLIPTVPENISAFNNDANYVTDNVLRKNLLIANALTTGNVSDNAVVYTDILSRLHSSFDLSKFTVVGSPTITDDGVASGFSNSSYIQVKNINFSKPFIVYSTETVNSTLSGMYGAFNVQPQWKYGVYFIVGSSGALYQPYEFSTENSVTYRVSWDGQTYKLEIKGDTVKTEWETIKTYESSEPLNGTSLTLGFNHNALIASAGSIDLKQFSITVDGEEVFSGNKTGVDRYPSILNGVTKQGNPTISQNGILNGLSGVDWIRSTSVINFSTANTWKIKCKFDYVANSTYEQGLFSGNGNTNIQAVINTSGILRCAYGNGNSWFFTPAMSLKTALIDGNTYEYETGFDGTQYYVALNGTVENTYTLSDKVGNTYVTIGIDRLRTRTQYFRGSVDLKEFSIEINGAEVWCPVLSIPYTLTKGEAKIADMQYLDRVKDVYNQGFTDEQYFTLDEENQQFTLPQGMSVYEGIANNTALIKANTALIKANTADIALKADKTSVTTMIMPDWNNGISVTSTGVSFAYTAPANGYIAINLQNNGGLLKINDISMMFCNANNGFNDSNSAVYPVSKDDVILLTAGVLTFYPCKEI